jgi:WD40 repeat protein/serine/threonine protein kinase
MAMADEPADLVGRQLGEFILREKIDEGGCAVVYRSTQPALKRDVVVKVLHARRWRNDTSQERFFREAQLASRLDHPYAAHVYAFGREEDGLLWIAMELVHGDTLSDWLETHGPMSLEQFVPFFECVAEVVHAAHERGIVHRDLKPSNVMVIDRDGRLFPKLLDFGIAKGSIEDAAPTPASAGEPTTEPLRAAPRNVQRTRTDPAARDPRLTRTSSRMGSSPYMSPEQWTNAKAVGPATDIYSLGILTYEALTGRRPFIAENTSGYYRLHLHAEVPLLGDDFTPELDRLVQRALAKDPDARHRDVKELASELRAALQVQPREQLRSLAAVWDARARSPALLLKSNDLMATPKVIGELERAFVAESRRHAVRSARVRRALAVSAVALVLGAVWYQGHLKTELADQRTHSAQQLVRQAEVEQGRQALLLHDDSAEAQRHLTEAYRSGDHSPGVKFMLARTLQSVTERARFASTSGRMLSATFSPDGRQIVTTDDQNAQVWDAASHRLLFALPHGDSVYHAVFSADGTRLVTAGGDGTVRIWNAANGSLVRRLSRDGGRRYYVVALSPDDRLVAAIDVAGLVADVWDAGTGTPLAELRNDAAEYPSIAFSADSRWLATGGGRNVRLFDTHTWSQSLVIGGPQRIISLAFDPKGPRLATGAAEGDASIWNIPSGARAHHMREIGEPVDAVAFSPDGELIVTASRDGAEQVWRVSSGALYSQGNFLHGKISSVEFDRTSRLVLAAGASGAIVVADAALGIPVSVLEGARASIGVAHFDASSRRVVGASLDGTARIWDATPPYHRWSSSTVSDDCGLVASLEPDQRFLAIGCRNHPARVWDTSRDQLLAELPGVSHVDGDFTSAFPAVSAAGDRAAIARGYTVEVYELPGGRLSRTITHGAAVNAVAFASRGGDLVSGAIDGSLLVSREGHEPVALPTSAGGIDAAGFLPDGRVIAADAGKRLRIYDPDRGEILADFATTTRMRSLRPSPDGLRLVTVPSYNTPAAPVLWDLEHYRTVGQLEGHVGRVYSARWVAGGHDVLTAGGDRTVRRWDGATGRPDQTYRGGSRFLADAALSPDGSLVVAGDGDGVLRFWDAASGRALWTMQAHKSHLVGVHFEGGDLVTRGFTGEVSRWTFPKLEAIIEACGDREDCAILSR